MLTIVKPFTDFVNSKIHEFKFPDTLKYARVSPIFKTKNLIKRECHNLKPQPNSATKRKGKRTNMNAGKINKHMYEKHINQLSLPQARCSQS